VYNADHFTRIEHTCTDMPWEDVCRKARQWIQIERNRLSHAQITGRSESL